MADRGIIFSAPMVRALLEGRKTQTRRLLKNAPSAGNWYCDPSDDKSGYRFVAEGGTPSLPCVLPHAVGDRLYVRETWGTGTRPHPAHGCVDGVEYRADDAFIDDVEDLPLHEVALPEGVCFSDYRSGWIPSIHMPRWASRMTLLVTDVRVQRLQDITCADAITEGIRPSANSLTIDCDTPDPRLDFAALWNSLHAKEGTTWADNPWIYALTFEVVHQNIDQLPTSLSTGREM